MLSIYKIVIRLTSQVLSNEDNSLVADRQTCNQILLLVADRQTCNQILLLELRALGTLDRRAHHLSYQGGPNSPQHTCIFIVLTNFVVLTWGRLCLKKLCFKPRQ